jgi:LmbE family N-acetylglucosaminyl deacetylase
VLAIGCHADDIEIGCGGTILELTRAPAGVQVHWVVLAATDERADESRSSAAAFLADADTASVDIHGFRDGFLPYEGAAVKEVFEDLKARCEPDLILTHTRDDLHQDHRLASELTWNTYRNHLILEYEIPKVDGDLTRPNLYMPLRESTVEEKIQLLLGHFHSQRHKHWFDAETFRGLMRIRGLECVAEERFAEAFVARKIQLGPGLISQASPFDALAGRLTRLDHEPVVELEASSHFEPRLSE